MTGISSVLCGRQRKMELSTSIMDTAGQQTEQIVPDIFI